MYLRARLCHLVSHTIALPRLHTAKLTDSGMAKAVADTRGENQAGFAYDTDLVTGFSHMHDSGTGGVSFFN
jgi:putative alpha-1,2-mannosidase